MNAHEFGTQIHGVKRSGQKFTGQCPAHEDRRASLSWRDGDKGIVVTCFAGCTIDAITDALGLTPAALFFEPRVASTPPPSRVITAHYPYQDEQGTLLYEVLRYQPKDFRQRKPDGKGGWVWALNGIRRVLYRLPDLIDKPEVWICEGERDADRLAALGLAATTAAGGAGKWNPEFSAWLAANGVKRIVVLPDNDPPGEAHGLAVAKACLEAGLDVRLVRLPELPPKGDVSNWLDSGYNCDALQSLVDKTPRFTGKTTSAASRHIISFADAMDAAVARQEGEPPEFLTTPFPGLNKLLCGGMVPGELYYLAAKGGEGKSAMCLELARHTSKIAGVLIISQEMGVPAVSRRLLAQEGQINARAMRQHKMSAIDWERFYGAVDVLKKRNGWIVSHAPSLPEIEAVYALTSGVKLVIVDYLQLLHGKGQDSRAQLEAVSKGLKAFATQHDVVVFCLSGVSARGEGKQKPSLQWLRGSGQLEHDCDVALLLHQPDSNSSARELIVAKARDAEVGSVQLQFSKDILHFVETELHRHEPTDPWERAK